MSSDLKRLTADGVVVTDGWEWIDVGWGSDLCILHYYDLVFLVNAS